MKATPYRTVRDGVISRMGIDPDQPLMASQATALAEYLTTAAATAWTFFDWPEVYLTEARTPVGEGYAPGLYTFESDYVGTTSYIGRALQGSQFADPVWRIKRVTTTAAGDLLNIDTAMEANEEQLAFTKIAAGTEPELPAEGQNHQLRAQVLQGIIQANPALQQRIQQDEIFRNMIEARMKGFNFQLQQQQNAQIGRQGTLPALQSPQQPTPQ